MIKQAFRKGVRQAINTRSGLRFCKLLASEISTENIWALVDPLIRSFGRFSKVNVPPKIDGFEDLAFLFSCWRGNRGLIRLDLDEAAYLFRLVKSLQSPLGVEIGRFKGGSTFLIASALRGGRLFSIDLHVTLNNGGVDHDKELEEILQTAGLRDQVNLVVGDSCAYDNRGMTTDFIFIDGDHSYEGVRADYEHWIGTLRSGGHVIFHDDHIGEPGVQKFIREVEKEKKPKKIQAPGSLAHFIK